MIPGWGAKILHVSGSKKQNIKNRSNMATNSTKTCKMAHVKKKIFVKKKRPRVKEWKL